MKKKEVDPKVKALMTGEVDECKMRLIRIESELNELGAFRKAEALMKIILRLEAWQNSR